MFASRTCRTQSLLRHLRRALIYWFAFIYSGIKIFDSNMNMNGCNKNEMILFTFALAPHSSLSHSNEKGSLKVSHGKKKNSKKILVLSGHVKS